MDERRRALRYTDPVRINYQVVLEPAIKEDTTSIDVSEFGIRFRMFERLKPGTLLRLAMELPYDALPISAEGQIRWVRQLDVPGVRQFEAGVELSFIEPRDFKRIQSFTVAAHTSRIQQQEYAT